MLQYRSEKLGLKLKINLRLYIFIEAKKEGSTALHLLTASVRKAESSGLTIFAEQM